MVRTLSSPVAAVYAAWTEPRALAQWLTPGADTLTSVTVDLVEGGRFRIEGTNGDGDAFSYCGTFLELVEDERIAMSWVYDGPVGALKGDASVVLVELKPLSRQSTKLTLTHEKLDARDAAEIYRISWTECMGKLETVAAEQAVSSLPKSGRRLPAKPPTKPREAPPRREFYTPGHREMQDRLKTRLLADRLEAVLVQDHLSVVDAAFITRQNMFFLATVDAYGQPNCSYKGGGRGFVTVVDEQTLAFPDYDGNGMHLSTGNIAETHKLGLLFVDFERQARMRVMGKAVLSESDPLLARYPGAQLIVRIAIESVFSNCPRYVHKMQLVEESVFVPQPDVPAEVPTWKRLLAVADVLPEADKRHAGTDTNLNKTLNKD